MMSPWLGMGLVLTVFGLLLTGLHAVRRLCSPDPEVLRKLLHIGMGILTLALPWLFGSTWPVLLLAFVFVLGMTALRVSGFLYPLNRVINGVKRRSLGDIYFPVAVGLLFLLSHGDPVTFCIPMLVLTFADAAAALLGRRYGALSLPVANGRKTLEGCAAFFIVAFLATHIPLLLFTDTRPARSLLIAAALALQIMLLEAVAFRGLDNLLIPLGAFLLLKSFLELNLTMLVARLSLAVLLVACLSLRSRHSSSYAGDRGRERWGSWDPAGET